MSDRRTFLGNAAAAAIIAKISPLRSFGFTSDGPETIHPTMSDREKAGLRGPVKQYTEETIIPGVQGGPEIRFSETTEYDPDGRILSTSRGSTDGSKWVTTKTYDADGRLDKTSSGKSGEPATESIYTYDERGRLKEVTNADGKGNRTSYRYDEEGRKTEVKTLGPEVFERNRKGVAVAGSQWEAAQIGIGALEGGSVTTLFDERDLPIELQILDSDERVIRRFIRSYDASGRIMGENEIQDNPAPTSGMLSELNDEQLETWKSLFRGRNGTGVSFVYDSQGRVTEVRDRNWALDTVTTTSYNERGDKSEERMSARSNLAHPIGVAFTIAEDGTIIPDSREAVSDPPPNPDEGELPPDLERTRWTIIEHRYEYDQNGNWTERTTVFRQVVDGSSESGEQSTVYRRTLTYF